MKKIILLTLLFCSMAMGAWYNVTSHPFYHVDQGCLGTGPNSAQKYSQTSIRALYAGKDTNTQWNFYSGTGHTFNTNLWTEPNVLMTGCTLEENLSAVCLLTDQHIITTAHISGGTNPPYGMFTNLFVFWDKTVGYCTNRATNRIILDNDICLMKLTVPVHPAFKPFKVFNTNWVNYFPYGLTSYCGTNDQFEVIWRKNFQQKLYVMPITDNNQRYIRITGPCVTTDGLFIPPTDFNGNGLWGIGGDSGSPIWMLMGTNAVFIAVMSEPSGGYFVSYPDILNQIKAVIEADGKALDFYEFPGGLDTFP